MEWNEELEKKLQRRGEIWHAEKLASRLIFDGRRALEHYTADATATTLILLKLSPSALHALRSAVMIKQRLHGGHIKTASW